MSTISGAVTQTVTLGSVNSYPTFASPLTITSSGTVDVASGNAVYGGSAGGWVVANQGIVKATGAGSIGIDLIGGGSVNNTGSISANGFGIEVSVKAGTAFNTGTISSTTAYGVYFTYGGSLTNSGSGYIFGGANLQGPAATVTNSSRIVDTTGAGVVLNAGGTIVNSGTIIGAGTFSAGYAAVKFASAGTLINSGTISNSSAANQYTAILLGGGYVTNSQSGYIGGGGIQMVGGTIVNRGFIKDNAGEGINLTAAGTVIDSGTINGSTGAIQFSAGPNLLALESGYKLNGVSGASVSDVLELLGATGALTVDFDKVGAGFTNFGTVAFGAAGGNDEILKVSNTLALPGTISGFTQLHDIVDVTQLSPVGASATLNGSDQLVVSNGTQTVTLQLDRSENYSGVVWSTSPDAGLTGTDITPACFGRGTLIRTSAGEIPIENLEIGDLVITFSGDEKPIRWIGHRAYDGRFITGNKTVLPIRVLAEALADGVPARDLWLSPEHSLYFNGVLVRAGHLVNGATIVQPDRVDQLEYFHIELDSHDVIFADGAAAETYVDCDNRMIFANYSDYANLYSVDERPHWQFCMPRLEWEADELTATRAALFARAEAQGHILTQDHGLHLIADGRAVEPYAVTGRTYSFAVPTGTAAVWLGSRTAVPAEVVPEAYDIRRLGVPVERIVLRDAHLSLDVRSGHAELRDGFHEDEATHRWTDGIGRLPEAWLRPFTGEITLEVTLAPDGLRYRLPGTVTSSAVEPTPAAAKTQRRSRSAA